MLSSTYRQSRTPADPSLALRAQEHDPLNRLLGHMPARRLSFEQFHDTLIMVSGELDPTMGGKAVKLFTGGENGFRRSIYGLVDRQFLAGAMNVFDFANPDLHTPARSETSIPQQALFALNHPFIGGRARSLARRIDADASLPPAERVARLYQTVLQRDPTSTESQACLAYLKVAEPDLAEGKVPATVKAWSYGYGQLDEAQGRLVSFQPLPYFNTSAWQGGLHWPDAALGWLQLTAQGGHAGNDKQHACVRRWTAASPGTISIRSEISHEVSDGDGVRAWIVSSRHGILKMATVHNQKERLDVDGLAVEPGDVVDFVVDLGAGLNSDMFVWIPAIQQTVTAAAPDAELATSWNAEYDFPGLRPETLSPLELLVQLLLISNEVMFVD
jgi:hypothetical protein